jgi:lysophospholipase L1-like esterase
MLTKQGYGVLLWAILVTFSLQLLWMGVVLGGWSQALALVMVGLTVALLAGVRRWAGLVHLTYFGMMGGLVLLPQWALHHLTVPLLAEPIPLVWRVSLFMLVYSLPLWSLGLGLTFAEWPQLAYWMPRLALSMASLGLVLGSAELALGLTYQENTTSDSYVNFFNITPENRHQIPPDTPFSTQVVKGAVYSADGRAYFANDSTIWYHQNSRGYRDVEFSSQRPPEPSLRLALVGDSLGEGYGVRYPDMAAVLLEALLSAAAGCPVQVYNFSKAGNNTQQERSIIENEVFNYQPDLILLWFYPNDIGHRISGFLGDTKVEYQITFVPERRFSLLAGFMGRRLDALLMANRLVQQMLTIYKPDGSAWQTLQADLEAIYQTSQTMNTPLLLFIHPILYRQHADYPFSTIHQQVLAHAQQHNIPAFDLTPALAGYPDRELWVNRLDLHPNELAHQLAAQAAADWIAPQLPACR